MDQPLPIAVFLSGSGRTLRNLIQHQRNHNLPVEIRLVISSSATAGGLQIAADAGIPSLVVRKGEHPDASVYCQAMFQPCRQAGIELVVMAGFLNHVLIPDDFFRRVINIHPSLIPAFCGQGMYGTLVHHAVVKKGVQVTGCTVHYVDNIYDNGPIMLQRWCPVLASDTPETVAKRVFELECEALPTAIKSICETAQA